MFRALYSLENAEVAQMQRDLSAKINVYQSFTYQRKVYSLVRLVPDRTRLALLESSLTLQAVRAVKSMLPQRLGISLSVI